MKKIVLATNNAHKLTELRHMFSALSDTEFFSLNEVDFSDDIIEDADTFEGNALIKARTVSAATSLTAIADDSGLSVDALGGAPGIFSARFTPEGTSEYNIRKLLDLLKDVPFEKRTARFTCVICVYEPNGEYRFFKGVCEGYIAFKSSGSGSFGYDPVFFYPPLNRTFAEIDESEKNKISHRGIAVKAMLDYFKSI